MKTNDEMDLERPKKKRKEIKKVSSKRIKSDVID